jgi:hypothetical protein
MIKPDYVALPEWFSPSLITNIQGAMVQAQVQEGLMQQLQTLTQKSKSSHFSLDIEDTSPSHASMLRFLKQLFIAYCKQNVQQHSADDCSTFLQEQARRDALQPRMESIHAFLKIIKRELEVHHEKTQQAGWCSVGYNRDESQAQLNHFKKIYNEMVRNDFSDLATCRILLRQVEEATSKNTFKRSFWLNSFYHDYLVQLQDALTSLERKIIHVSVASFKKESMKHFYLQDEKKSGSGSVENAEHKRQKRVSVVESGCSLYGPKEQHDHFLPISTDSVVSVRRLK